MMKAYRQNPLVSVIIPVYNVAPFLREALDSVLGQTYKRLEILVVDDGSTDESGLICDEYREDPRVTVVHQENHGLSHARNVGLDRMTGEFVCFLDSDDAYEPEFVELMLESLKKEKADISVCRYTIHATDARMQRSIDRKRKKEAEFPPLEPGSHSREEALRALVEGRMNTSVWNKLYRKSLWDGIRFPVGHNYEDLDTIYKVLNLCSSVFMSDQCLHLYRERSGSITHTPTKKNHDDRDAAYFHLQEFVTAHTPEIFRDMHADRIRLTRLNRLIVNYAEGTIGKIARDELKCRMMELAKEIGHWRFKSRAAYGMVLYCPWLLKVSYPVYHSIQMFIRKVTGK